MSEQVSVLFANDAFYLALANRDMAAMDDIWAAEAPVSCIHPGWPPLSGRDEVMGSWRNILGNTDQAPIEHLNASARAFDEFSVVLCHELVAGTFLIATNLFVRENGAWKLIHHQSGGSPPPEDIRRPDTPDRLQ